MPARSRSRKAATTGHSGPRGGANDDLANSTFSGLNESGFIMAFNHGARRSSPIARSASSQVSSFDVTPSRCRLAHSKPERSDGPRSGGACVLVLVGDNDCVLREAANGGGSKLRRRCSWAIEAANVNRLRVILRAYRCSFSKPSQTAPADPSRLEKASEDVR
jgi:hypothetical protein